MDVSIERSIVSIVNNTKAHRDAFAIPELIKILKNQLQTPLDDEASRSEITLNFVDTAAKALLVSPIYSDTLMREFYRSAIDVAEAHGVPRQLILEDLLFQSLKRSSEGETFKRKKQKDVRRRILQAALTEFSDKGYHASTIDSIAERADIAKGTVYRYFKTKESIFTALKEDTMSEFVELARKDLANQEDVLTIIESVIKMYLSFFEQNSSFFKVIIQEHKDFGREFSEKFIQELILALPGLKRRCWKASRSGRLKQMNYFTVFYGIIGFLNGVIQKWLSEGAEKSMSAEIDTVREVLFYGFAIPPSKASNVNPLKVIS
ncbi:MAG: TetR/AcrR family transcriptional regulator [Deltaproteobacteria bacterium]|nr:TetR/AcrR family transcriptional regulator [Deltaproteobacteria bacterium]